MHDDGCHFVSSYLPLGTPSRWLKGNHHGHSTQSDGTCSPQEEVRAYEAAGYDYFALSEHDLFVDPMADGIETSLVRLPAVEVTSDAGQTLMYLGAGSDLPRARTQTLAEIAGFVHERGGVFIVDHPNWLYRSGRLHADVAEIAQAKHVGGIEIYTGVIERLPGSPLALDTWDRLLSAGARVFGHAVDDQHVPLDRFLGWNCVQWVGPVPPTAAEIIGRLGAGQFYASTGVRIGTIGVSADHRRITVESDAAELRWIVRDGIVAHVSRGGAGTLDLAELHQLSRVQCMKQQPRSAADLLYVRVEARGDAGAFAWSQPFFIRNDG